MSEELIRLTLDPTDYVELLALLDARIRSERGRISAFRHHRDLSNEMVAVGTRRRLLELKEALVAGVEGGHADG
ncbi:MAG: hypothetical protein LAT64_09005 [Phycisphaerales bacterium]|nr:hypothetical protein [Planctomycetota bacterium]MCH8508888.1 hypothetical protein [Phycisphaerales bacterium]